MAHRRKAVAQLKETQQNEHRTCIFLLRPLAPHADHPRNHSLLDGNAVRSNMPGDDFARYVQFTLAGGLQ